MKLLRIVLIFFIFSCHNSSEKTNLTEKNPQLDSIHKVLNIDSPNNTIELQEYFADSLDIGRKGLNKIEVFKYKSPDRDYVVIKYYSKTNHKKWALKNNFEFEKDAITGCSPKISDFNNDKFKDFTYISNIGGRGANEIRKLFIYNRKLDKLTLIKNSDAYPNMRYNDELNCIDAFIVTASTTTAFLRIEDDSLRPFAYVHLGENLIVSEFNKKGQEKVIRQDTANELEYVRFKNYKPLKPYKE